MQETSFLLEADRVANHATHWTFDGPLVTMLNELIIVPGKPIKLFKTAKRRREVRTDRRLSVRRDDLLSIAEKYFNRSLAPGSRMLSRTAEGHFKDEMALLDSVLLNHPSQVSRSGEIGYYIEPFKYKRLQDSLNRLIRDHSSVLQSLNLNSPNIPTLPQEWPRDSLWKAKELEVLCVTLHEDVENFLAFYWDIVVKTKGIWRPSKDDVSSPSFPEEEELSWNPEIFQIHYAAAYCALWRKIAADTCFIEAKATTAQETLAIEHENPP